MKQSELIEKYSQALDESKTPVITVDTSIVPLILPQDHIEDDEIVFNIHPVAIRNLRITDSHISFIATYSGKPYCLSIPLICVKDISFS